MFKKIGDSLADLRNWKEIVEANKKAEEKLRECTGKNCAFHDNRPRMLNV